MRVELKGTVISPGVALGRVVLLNRSRTIVERRRLEPASIESEKKRFLSAVERSKEQILSIKKKLDPRESGTIFKYLTLAS